MNKRNIDFFTEFAKKFEKKNYAKKENGLFPQQRLVVKFMQEPNTRGLLLYHGLGSGKTIASIASIVNVMKSKSTNIENACIFLPGFLLQGFKQEVVKFSQDLDDIEFFVYNATNVRDKLYKHFGADNLSDLIGKMENHILIFDEAHHLISMMHNALIVKERNEKTFLDKQIGFFFYDLLMNLKNVKIMFLTATPITNYAYEAAVLGNVLYGRATIRRESESVRETGSFTLFPENSLEFYEKFIDPSLGTLLDNQKGDFERRFTGLISFYPSSQELYTARKEYPSIRERNIAKLYLFYNTDQYKVYNEIFEAEKQQAYIMRWNNMLSSNFRIFSRMASNFVFPQTYFVKFKKYFFTQELKGIKDISLAEFMSFQSFKRFCREKGLVSENLFSNFFYKSLLNCFVDIFFKTDLYKYYFEQSDESSLSSFSVKLDDLKNSLQRIDKDEKGIIKNQKVLIYSNFVNYAGKQSIEALLDYMGYKKEVNFRVDQGAGEASSKPNNQINLFNDLSTEEQEQQNEEERETANESHVRLGILQKSAGVAGQRKKLLFDCRLDQKILSALKPNPETELKDLGEHQHNLQKNSEKKYLSFEGESVRKREIVEKFNTDPACQILIISSSGSEGIDLKNVRYLFILEPFWNMNRIDQVIGRAQRYLSHVDLSQEKRDIVVEEMITLDAPDEHQSFGARSVDWEIRQLALRKSRLIGNILESLKNSSIDCSYYEPRRTCSRFKYNMTTFNKKRMSSEMYNLFPTKSSNLFGNKSTNGGKNRALDDIYRLSNAHGALDDIYRISSISQYLERKHFQLFPLISVNNPRTSMNNNNNNRTSNARLNLVNSTTYLGRVIDDKRQVYWKIVLFNGEYYTVVGTLYKQTFAGDDDMSDVKYDILVRDENKNVIYELVKSELERGIFNPKM
jgi:superfamily II DNA or RNA helicase